MSQERHDLDHHNCGDVAKEAIHKEPKREGERENCKKTVNKEKVGNGKEKKQ